MLSGKDIMMYHGLTNNLMFVRALIEGAMDKNGFEKEKLERKILEWMPYKVGNHIHSSCITCVYLQIDYCGLTECE